MFILIPTCPTYQPIARASLALLDHYWPDHPPAVLAEDTHNAGWVATATQALREAEDPLFLLLLDDYGVCAPPREDLIAAGIEALREDESAALFSLCWHPAQSRTPHEYDSRVVRLAGAPLLLQAAVWRRSAFLDLSQKMDPRTSAWGFESRATQLLKRTPLTMLAANIPHPTWIGGTIPDGFDKSHWPLPYHNLMHRGQPALQYESFLHAHGLRFPSRGLGDTIAQITRATGIDQWVPKNCGCANRRETLNRIIPFR